MNGIEIGDAAMGLLNAEFVDALPPHGPNIAQATERLDHLSGTKAEWQQAVAYVALQAAAYRRIANEDAALAIANIESIVNGYRGRRQS